MKKTEAFCDRLKHMREKRKYTQKQLADKIKISEKAIGNYEQDISTPNATYLLKLAEVLDVTPEYLLNGEENMVTYTNTIKAELMQLKDADKINTIKNEELNATILAHLQLNDDFINDIKNEWNGAHVFKKKDENGKVVNSYCTRNYVCEVVIRYCQNRSKYKQMYKINDGMLS